MKEKPKKIEELDIVSFDEWNITIADKIQELIRAYNDLQNKLHELQK